MKTVKTYTIKEAIGELDAIRMYASAIAKKQSKEVATIGALISELASVTLWTVRHLDHLESEILIPEIEDESDKS